MTAFPSLALPLMERQALKGLEKESFFVRALRAETRARIVCELASGARIRIGRWTIKR